MLLNSLHTEAALVDLSLRLCTQPMLCLVSSEEISEDGPLKQAFLVVELVVTVAPHLLVLIHHVPFIFITRCVNINLIEQISVQGWGDVRVIGSIWFDVLGVLLLLLLIFSFNCMWYGWLIRSWSFIEGYGGIVDATCANMSIR